MTIIPKPNQIRAARGLCNWTVTDLGKLIGVAPTTISAIETGRSAGSLEVLTNIFYAFQAANVELTEDGGVRPKQEQIYTLTGQDNFLRFFDSMYEDVEKAKELYACNIDEELFDKWLGKVSDDHIRRMQAIEGLYCLTLVEEGKNYFPCDGYTEYRWVKKDFFDAAPFYTFGEKVAILLFEDDVTIIVIQHPDVARAYKKQFFMAWENALPIPEEQKG